MPEPIQSLGLEIDEKLTIGQVEVIHSEWTEYLKAKQDISIDARNVKQVDSAGLQLLIAFVLAVNKQGKAVSWIGYSQPIIEVIELLGMERYLMSESG